MSKKIEQAVENIIKILLQNNATFSIIPKENGEKALTITKLIWGKGIYYEFASYKDEDIEMYRDSDSDASGWRTFKIHEGLLELHEKLREFCYENNILVFGGKTEEMEYDFLPIIADADTREWYIYNIFTGEIIPADFNGDHVVAE